MQITVLVRHVPAKEFDLEKCPEGFRLGGCPTPAPSATSSSGGAAKAKEEEEEEDDDCCMILDDPIEPDAVEVVASDELSSSTKRSRPSDGEEALAFKVKRPAV